MLLLLLPPAPLLLYYLNCFAYINILRQSLNDATRAKRENICTSRSLASPLLSHKVQPSIECSGRTFSGLIHLFTLKTCVTVTFDDPRCILFASFYFSFATFTTVTSAVLYVEFVLFLCPCYYKSRFLSSFDSLFSFLFSPSSFLPCSIHLWYHMANSGSAVTLQVTRTSTHLCLNNSRRTLPSPNGR